MRKGLALILVLVMLITIGLVGCGGQKESGKAQDTTKVDTKAETKAETKATEAKKVTLEWWDCDTREPWVKAHDKIINDFKAKYPNVEFIRTQTGAELEKMMQTGAAANALPDMVYAAYSNHSLWAFQGITVPVDDVIENIGKDKFSPMHLMQATVNGKTYSVPVTYYPHVLFYRNDLYKKYNLSIPKNWDELYQNAKTISEKENGIAGFQYFNGPGQPYYLTNLMGCNGAANFDQNGNVTINNPETVETLKFIQKISALSPKGSAAKTQSDARMAFIKGSAAHLMDSTSVFNVILSDGGGDTEKFAACPIPVNKGNWGAMNDFAGIQVTKSADMDMTKEYLKFMESDAEYFNIAANGVLGHLPCQLTVYDNPEYWKTERIAKFAELIKQVKSVAENGVGMGVEYGPNPYAGIVRSQDIWKKMVDMMLLQNKSPEDSAKWAQSEMEKIKKDVDKK